MIKEIKPNEIYNLAAQSHVQVSFESPEYTANADALGALRILEAIRFNKLEKKQNTIKQAHQNYMAEMKKLLKMKEQTFILQVHMVLQNFMRIGLQSTIKKPIIYLLVTVFCLIMKAQEEEKLLSLKKLFKLYAELKKKKQRILYLGNLYAKRDWGHARDYVEAMWLMLQQKKPIDLVISTGKQSTVKNFVNKVSKKLNMKLSWKGKGISEKAVDQNGKTIVACDRNYYRPLEVNNLLGDSRKARKLLNWKPKTGLDDLISEMVNLEINRFDYK